MATLESWPSIFPNPTINYSVVLETNAIRTQQGSGRLIQRTQFTRENQFYPVSWQLKDDKYEEFEAWRYYKLTQGMDWFYVELAQGGGLKRVKARIVRGTYNASYRNYFNWEISCQLEVEEIPRISEEELNQRLLLGNSSIDEIESAVNSFEKLYDDDLYSVYNFRRLT